MFKLVAIFAVLAVASAQPFLGYAGGLGAPLLPKVSYEPAEVKTIKQEYTVHQPEYVYRDVPVPVPVAQPYAAHYPVPVAVPHAVPVAHTVSVAHPVAYSGLHPYGGYFAPALTAVKSE